MYTVYNIVKLIMSFYVERRTISTFITYGRELVNTNTVEFLFAFIILIRFQLLLRFITLIIRIICKCAAMDIYFLPNLWIAFGVFWCFDCCNMQHNVAHFIGLHRFYNDKLMRFFRLYLWISIFRWWKIKIGKWNV